jgi:small GTP-binding protein
MSEISLKILLIGDSSVGKTSLLIKYTEEKFTETQIATIGVEYKNKTIEYKGYKIKLQIWDTSGQERFRSLTQNFYRNADGIIFVFDLTKPDSFDNIRSWLIESENYADNFGKILIGNKCDLPALVTQERIDSFISKKNLAYFNTSAKDGTNVVEMFQNIIEQIIGDKSEEEILRNYASERSRIVTKIGDVSTNKIINEKKKCC